MREILFRGKDIAKNWYYGSLHIQDGETDDEGNQCLEYRILGMRGECDYIIPETVGQYTGLTDKNGKKIFEGDIIRFADIYEYEMYLESLEQPEDYEKKAFDNMWTIDKVGYGLEYSYPAFDLSKQHFDVNGLSELCESFRYHYEVIGNIHDNPELLKEGAE